MASRRVARVMRGGEGTQADEWLEWWGGEEWTQAAEWLEWWGVRRGHRQTSG